MDEGLKEQLSVVLKNIIPYAKGMVVYGSFIKGYADESSDIDICVIKKGGASLRDLYQRILEVSADERYDIVIFSEIPWYLRGEVLEDNEVVYAENGDELDFWLYKQSKIWTGMKRRQRLVSVDDLIDRVRSV